MKTKHVFESIIFSAIFVSLLASLFCAPVSAAYPGPDNLTAESKGASGSSVSAQVTGKYASGIQDRYNGASYTVRRNPGTASNEGDLYYCTFVDGVFIEGTTSASTYSTSASSISAQLVASHIKASFKSGSTIWPLEATAFVKCT